MAAAPHRPTKLTPGMQAAICEAVKQTGCSDTAACAVNGICADTLTDWRKRGASGEQPFFGFVRGIHNARAEHEHVQLQKMQERGEAQQDWREIAWRLERGFREHWGKVERAEISGPNGGPIETYDHSAELDSKLLGVLARIRGQGVVRELDSG